jgi:outer membrane protein
MRIAMCAAIGALLVGAMAAAPATAESLTLSDAISTALRDHGSVAIADRQVQQAESGVTVARSGYWPQLLTNWQYTYTESRGGRRFTTLGGVPVGVGGSQEAHQTTLVSSYTLWDSGLRAAQLHGAQATLERADSGLELARTSLSFRVTGDYLDLLRQQRALQLAREQVDQAKSHLALVQARIDAGLTAPVDKYPLEASLAQAQLALITSQNQAAQASITLRNSMGLPAGPPFEAQEPVMTPDISSLPPVEQALEVAERTRPDLLQAQATVRAGSASYELARISTRPVLSVGTTYVIKAEPAPSGKELVLDAQMTFPIFDAGSRRAQANEARQSLESSRLNLMQLRKDEEAQVAQARLAVTTAWERINASAVSVTAASKSLASAEARYKAGLAIPIEITDAQVQYYNAQLDAANAHYDYFTALASLRNAVGLETESWDNLSETRLLQP